jgi:hypothetical protein
MSLFDKVEVMDFLINVLKDHEKSLDSLISRAENVLAENEERLGDNGDSYDSPIKIVLKDWSEFKRRLENVELVCFDLVDQVFMVSAKTRQKVYEYRERVPELTLEMKNDNNILITSSDRMNYDLSMLNSQLTIGLKLSYRREVTGKPEENIHKIIYDIDPQYTRKWLSDELGIHQDYIVCGDIEL